MWKWTDELSTTQSVLCLRFHAHQTVFYNETLRQIASSVATTLSGPNTSNDFLTLNDWNKNAHKRIYRQYVWCMPYRIDGLSEEPMMMVVLMTCVRPVLVNKFHSRFDCYSSASYRYTANMLKWISTRFSCLFFVFFLFFSLPFTTFFWYCPVCRCRRRR